MNAAEVAGITGLSVRTLHHYDKIGLVCPNRNPENSYREYSEAELDKLQQVLFFKECGFTLEKIRQLLSSPGFDRQKAFELHRKHLLHEKKRIDSMLKTLEKTMRAVKGEINMSQKEKFGGFDFSHNPYEDEARKLWGDDTVDRSNAYIGKLSDEQKNDLSARFDEMHRREAALMHEDPASGAVQAAMELRYKFLNTGFGHHYTPEAFAGLGQMYVDDTRFTETIDKYSEGLAAFLAKAMRIYADTVKPLENR